MNGNETSFASARETSLHLDLKGWYVRPGDQVEAPVGSYKIDIIRGRQLIEIQTGNFSALKPKLAELLPVYPLRVVHPIARERWIRRVSADNEPISQRKSPKRGRVEELFTQLVRLPEVVKDPNFSLEILLIQDEVIYRNDGRGSWRRKGWSIADRVLLDVLDSLLLSSPADYAQLLPGDLESSFTNSDLVAKLNIRPRLAGQMTYCLRKMGTIDLVGKRGRANLYRLN